MDLKFFFAAQPLMDLSMFSPTPPLFPPKKKQKKKNIVTSSHSIFVSFFLKKNGYTMECADGSHYIQSSRFTAQTPVKQCKRCGEKKSVNSD